MMGRGKAASSRRTPKALAAAVAVFCIAITGVWASELRSPVTKTVLPNGLCIIFKPEPGSGLVAIETLVKAGAPQERDSKTGIGNLVARALFSSTRNRSMERMAQAFDEVGGSFRTDWYPDFTEISAITTVSQFDEAVNIMADILLNAEFDPTVVQRVQQTALAEARGGTDDIYNAVYTELLENLYTDSPYRRPKIGYASTLQGISREDMIAFYKGYYVPNNMVVSVVGDLTEQQVVERFRRAFAGVGASNLPPQRLIGDESVARPITKVSEKEIPVAYIVAGYLAPGVTSPDFAAATALNAVLGGGKASRLFSNIRDKQGIGYEIGATYPILQHQSHLMAMLVTDLYKPGLPGFPPQIALQEVKDALLNEINALKEQPISDDELLRAKRFAIGSYALRHERLRERAFFLAWMEAIGAGYQADTDFALRIEAVTKADIQRVAQKYLNNPAVVVALPQTKSVEPPSPH